MPTTPVFLSEWKTGIFTPTGLLAGYSGGALPAHPLLEVFGDPDDRGAVYHVSGKINLATLTDKQVQGLYTVCHPLSGTIGGKANLRVETGETEGAGSVFTPLTPEGVFSGAGVREVKVWPEFSRWEFNPAAVSGLGITWVTFSWNTDGMANPQRLLGEMLQAILAGSGGGGASTPNYLDLTAGETLAADSVVYMAGGTVYQLDDPSDPAQANRGWIDAGYSIGETARVYFSGIVDKPSAISALPTDREIYASPGGSLTWDGDTTDPLGSGDFYLYMGRSWDAVHLMLNALAPVAGKAP